MKNQLNDKVRLEHIRNAINSIEEYSMDKSYDDIVSNAILRHAITQNIQVIGEAANNLSKDFIENHSKTNWRGIIGMRHVLVHDYYQIDAEEVWNVITEDLPQLKTQIEQYIAEMQ